MKHKRTARVLSFALAVLLCTALAQAGEVTLTLQEAIRRGLEHSPAMQRAHLALELMELEYRQAEVNAHATVSPLELAAAKQAYENARFQVELQRVQTALEVELQVYNVMKAEDTVHLRQDALERAMQQADIAQRRHAVGQITNVQLREAEQRLRVAELAFRQATNNLFLARVRLGQYIGVSATDIKLTVETDIKRVEVDFSSALATAEENRFEMIQALQAIESAEQAVKLADNDYTPRIELERARIQLAQAQLNMKQARDLIHREVLEAVMRLEEAEARLELALSEQDLAAENLTLAELRYQNGLSTFLDVLEAEAALAEARVQAIAATYDYNIARAQYMSAVGLGFERWPELKGEAEGVN